MGEKNNKLEDFGHEEPGAFLDEPIKTVVAFRDQLTPEHIRSLLPLLSVLPIPEEEIVYGADFDVAGEINRMILSTRAMQAHIMEGGKIKKDTPLREVKEAVTAANTMIASLMKHHREVVNLSRMTAIEKATVKVMRAMGKEDEFLQALEKELEAVE